MTFKKKFMKNWIRWKNFADLVGRAIQEEPPLAMKEGGIIKDGYNEEVDRLRKAKSRRKELAC